MTDREETMTDHLKTRLADALREHEKCGYSHAAEGQLWEEHIADVLLNLPDIAIVDMTDTNAINDVVVAIGRYLDIANSARRVRCDDD